MSLLTLRRGVTAGPPPGGGFGIGGVALTDPEPSSPYTFNLPAGSTAADYLLLSVAALGAVTTPVGWDLILENANNLYVFGKAGAGETSIDLNEFAQCGIAYLVTQADGAEAAISGDTNPPNLAPTWGSRECVWIIEAKSNYDKSATTWTNPANYTDQNHAGDGGAGSAGRQLATATRILTAASENPAAWGVSGSTSSIRSATVAVRNSVV